MYQVTIMDGVAANADLTTSATVYEYPQGLNNPKVAADKGNMSLEVVSTSNGTTGTVQLQHSDNGTTFNNLASDGSDTITLSVAGTYTITPVTNVSKRYYRLIYLKGNGTIGIVTSTLTFS